MTVQDYLKLPYHVVISHKIDESGDYYFATVQEMGGVRVWTGPIAGTGPPFFALLRNMNYYISLVSNLAQSLRL